MKIFQILVALGGTILLVAPTSYSQDSLDFEITYEVNKIYPPLSMSKDQLHKAETIIDLNKYFKPTWVKEYISIEIITLHGGKKQSALSNTKMLSQEQINNMQLADIGSTYYANIEYLPNNSLTHNDPKQINFSWTIEPDKEASFVGGQQKLRQYLDQQVIKHITDDRFTQHQLTAVTFSINEVGQILEVQLFQTSNDDELDQLLLETLCNMPDWTPAEYTNGLKIKQDFALTAGDHNSCVINLLNIKPDNPRLPQGE